MIKFDKIEGFQWDKGNIDKNLQKHGISNNESEQIFFNEPLIVAGWESIHSTSDEIRYFALGKTNSNKQLTVIFTIRENLIRIISARLMSKKEKEIYHEKT